MSVCVRGWGGGKGMVKGGGEVEEKTERRRP